MLDGSGNTVAVVMSYQQSTLNSSFALSSTAYAYWVRNDPVGTLRLSGSLSSVTQAITNINRTNPIFSGLVVVPGKNEFSIYGPGNAWNTMNSKFE